MHKEEEIKIFFYCFMHKDDKKGAKKGGKDAPPASPLEQEKLDLEKAIEFSKNAITKYTEKRVKIEVLKAKT